jgi:hypothetical protein
MARKEPEREIGSSSLGTATEMMGTRNQLRGQNGGWVLVALLAFLTPCLLITLAVDFVGTGCQHNFQGHHSMNQ